MNVLEVVADLRHVMMAFVFAIIGMVTIYCILVQKNIYKCFISGYVQAYGRCWGEKSAVFLSDTEKYRKPTPPPKPTWCYCEKKNGHREICDQHRNKEECRDVHYPNEFDPNTQFCR